MSKKEKLFQQELNLKKQSRLNEAERLGIAGMLESNIPIRKIVSRTGRSIQAICNIKKNDQYTAKQIEQIKKKLSGKLYGRADEAVDLMGDGRLKEMSAFQLAGITKHTVETARLRDDQSTANVAQLIGIDPALRQALSGLSRKMSAPLEQIEDAQIVEIGGGEAANSKDNNETSDQD